MAFKKKTNWKKLLLVILNIVLSVVFLAALSLTVYVEWLLSRFQESENQTATMNSQQVENLLQEDQNQVKPEGITEVKPEDVQWEIVENPEAGNHIFNILLVGQDRRPGEMRARSDTMILVTINTEDYSVTTTSFMRDLYVQIPGMAPNRLNVPYAVGGFDLLADTMELNFGIRPDRYLEVDFSGFERIVEAVGGVDVELTADEAAYFNQKYGFGAAPGMFHLNAENALRYARCRSIEGDGDFSRTRRQRTIVSAVIAKAKTLDLAQINEMVLAMTDVFTTNLTSTEILSYVVKFYPQIQMLAQPKQISIPYGDAYYSAWVDGVGAVLVPDLKSNSAIIAKTQE